MNRIFEALAHSCVFAPQSVDAVTAKTTDYVDVSGADEVEFLLSTGALGAGKSVTVEVLTSKSADGTGAVKVAEAEFADEVGGDPALAVISFRPTALHDRYVAVKFQHDAVAAVSCAVTVSAKVGHLPAVTGMTLVV